jgi:2-oxoglutarate dehydrogenase E1 component
LSNGNFQEILDDSSADPAKVKRIVLCSGKLYFDLLEDRDRQKGADTALIRIEQLYPLNTDKLEAVMKRYKKSQLLVWAQEESQNMGAWSFIDPRLRALGLEPHYVGRDASASPATGLKKIHEREQKELVEKALRGAGTHLVGARARGSQAEASANSKEKVSARA